MYVTSLRFLSNFACPSGLEVIDTPFKLFGQAKMKENQGLLLS